MRLRERSRRQTQCALHQMLLDLPQNYSPVAGGDRRRGASWPCAIRNFAVGMARPPTMALPRQGGGNLILRQVSGYWICFNVALASSIPGKSFLASSALESCALAEVLSPFL